MIINGAVYLASASWVRGHEISWDYEISWVGRVRPIFLMRLRSVLGCMFKDLAAPWSPSMIQLLLCRAARICSRSTSFKLPVGRGIIVDAGRGSELVGSMLGNNSGAISRNCVELRIT